MADLGWIEVSRWDEFQHYKDRSPLWIKVYTRLLHEHNFMSLSAGERALLLMIWLEAASSWNPSRDDVATTSQPPRLRAVTSSLTRQFNMRTTSEQLKRLEQAGFIRLVASSALANGYLDASARGTREETEREREEPAEQCRSKTSNPPGPAGDLSSEDPHKGEEPFAVGPEPALPLNGATADDWGLQPLEPAELRDRWKAHG